LRKSARKKTLTFKQPFCADKIVSMENKYHGVFMDLEGQTAVVTGGINGIGAAISLKLCECGANVALIDRKPEEDAKEIIKTIQSKGRKALFIRADVSDFTEAGKAISAVIREFGKVDILVNNAGISRDSVIWKMTEEQWDDVLSVNLKGYFNYIRAVAPIFREQKSGKIISISSINGLRGKFGMANYSSAKAGIIGLTKTIAKELGKYNVNVNAIAPGMIVTDMSNSIDESARNAALEDTVLKRLGQPEDVAGLVAFLCTGMAKHITGEVIKVDGGQYI
jgi:3-oxoacyl-[acyl-carrier protein] reductase